MSFHGPLLHAQELSVGLKSGGSIIDGVSLSVAPGEILALVGESGSGKTTTALALFGDNTAGLVMTAGEITLAGERLDSKQAFRRARGRLVSYVPQDPGSSLNPSMRVNDLIADVARTHRGPAAARSAPGELLRRVGLPNDDAFSRRYPHQLSGGQQQRVSIAAALASRPAVVVLDEPTTGLDVITQSQILLELKRLRTEEGISMLYITHDLAVVAEIADRIAVMYAGQIVEEGPTEVILRSPRHPYTRGLVGSTPDHLMLRTVEPMPGISAAPGERPSGCRFAPRCSWSVARCVTELPKLEAVTAGHGVRCFEWPRVEPVAARPMQQVLNVESDASEAVALEVEHLRAVHEVRRQAVVAVDDVSFSVEKGSCVALVGESGSGKTTVARVIAGLHPAARGQILLDGKALPGVARRRTKEERRRIQIIFQNPMDALNPRHTVADAIIRPEIVLRGLDRAVARAEVVRLLDAVRLPARVATRYPSELSGGERQRVAIARALAARPEIIICDEITSALDVSVQAALLKLVGELRTELGASLLFITHDLGVVASVAQRVLVLEKGRICEKGSTRAVLTAPQHRYTQQLLSAAPSLSAKPRVPAARTEQVS